MSAVEAYIIAGEESGDLLGGRLMAALKEITDLKCHGIGGASMSAEGLKSAFPMTDLSVMGVAEVLPRLPLLLKRIRQTIDDIIARQPDVVVTIDSPDFCFRVIKGLRQRGYDKPCVHYVAPSVWAWRPKRAAYVSTFLDHIFCLLPFEPPYFERYGLGATYIGHAAIEGGAMMADASRFRSKHDLGSTEPLIALLPGSRKSELSRHMDLFVESATMMQKKFGQDFTAVVPTLPHLKSWISQHEGLKKNLKRTIIVDNADDKYDAFAAADVALAASGTVTLELGLTRTPMVVSYKMAPITAFIAKRLVKAKYVSLINLILDAPCVPEILLGDATPERLSNAMLGLLMGKGQSTQQKQGFEQLRQNLRLDRDLSPSQIAAEKLLEII